FVTWRLVEKPGRPKPDKVLFNPATGNLASVSDPATWGDYATARAAFERGSFNGVGFVFTTTDPFAFVDLDDCADPITGQWKPHALAIMATLPGAWEISQSGTGLHGVSTVT